MAKGKSRIWDLVDRLEGDKVVWIIALMLLMISVVLIFSSSSRLTDISHGVTRLEIVKGQAQFVLAALGIMLFICYVFRRIETFRWLSQWGFLLSLGFLLALQAVGSEINGAVRIIKVGGFQIHVFEVVKVAMVMYMAWAVDAFKTGRFKIVNRLSDNPKFTWLSNERVQKFIFIFLPFLATTGLVMQGSNSSALFIALVMFLTIAIGGINMGDLFKIGGGCCVLIGFLFLGFVLTKNNESWMASHNNKPAFARIGTAIGRLKPDNWEKEYKIADAQIHEATNASERAEAVMKRQIALDNLRQPYSAKIAIRQGGLTGKGPGQSTQRYVVPDMPEDYMFSFILEEYGLLGGIIVMVLYLSLLARGSIIVRNCGKNLFAKNAVAGLTLLITGQAFLHILVNADMGPMTGQTLPLLSHGNFALVCFSIAFGIILSISRIAQKGIDRESRKAESLVAQREETAASLSDLEDFESENIENDIQ